MKEQSKSLLLWSVLLISIVTLAGCATKHTTIVYSSLAPFPVALESAIIIATNDEIPVTVGDSVSKKDIGGYAAVHTSDMEALVEDRDKLLKMIDDLIAQLNNRDNDPN